MHRLGTITLFRNGVPALRVTGIVPTGIPFVETDSRGICPQFRETSGCSRDEIIRQRTSFLIAERDSRPLVAFVTEIQAERYRPL